MIMQKAALSRFFRFDYVYCSPAASK